jgi:Ca2+-binding RTX toxin-like protein
MGTEGDDDILVTAAGPVDVLGGFDIVRFDFLYSPVGIHLDLTGVWSGGDGRLNGFEIRGMEALGGAFGGALGDSNPFVVGSQHDDIIILGAGYSWYSVIVGDEGNDVLVAGGGGPDLPVPNFLDGGSGDDLLIGNAYADTLIGEEGDDRLFGGGGPDDLFGNAGSDSLHGGDGADGLSGGEGDDQMFGEAGDDLFQAGLGADLVDGGTGSDTVLYLTAEAGVTVNLQAGTAREGAGGPVDHLVSIENATGSFFSDVLSGSNAANRLGGDAGDDRLSGRGGDDILSGGPGADRLEGGSGADTFVFQELDSGRDVIVDFNVAAGDRIDVSGIDAVAEDFWVDDAFRFVGNAVFSGAAGELRVAAADGGWEVSGDVDGDGLADFSILVVSAAAPVLQDFVL